MRQRRLQRWPEEVRAGLRREGDMDSPGSQQTPAQPTAAKRLTPSAIVNFLDQYVVGQDEAKKTLSVAVYSHYRKIGKQRSSGAENVKTNILLIGPTGTGKTLLCETLSRIVRVPFVTANATSLAQSKYVNEEIEALMLRLLDKADGDIAKAQRGIVLVDEIDKLKSTQGEERGTSGERVQHALRRFHERYPQVSGHSADELEAPLRKISEEVFADLLQQDFAARAWLARWFAALPAYLEWQAESEAQGWRYAEAESAFDWELEGVRLRGRIDRLDVNGQGKRVLDYKTQSEQVLRNKLREPGEDVQLACYAYAHEAADAAFVSIENGRVKLVEPKDDVPQLAQLNAERLVQVMGEIRGGAGMPANGIDAVCVHCEMRDVCRKGEWS